MDLLGKGEASSASLRDMYRVIFNHGKGLACSFAPGFYNVWILGTISEVYYLRSLPS